MKQKSKLTLFRMEAGLTAIEVVRFLKDKAPLIDKTVISKAEHPDLYGVELSKELWAALQEGYPEAFERAKKRAQGRKGDRHKQTRRVSVRLSEEKFLRLQQHLEQEGMTTQEYFVSCIPSVASTNDTCQGCAFYPPSSLDGKPCTQCWDEEYYLPEEA